MKGRRKAIKKIAGGITISSLFTITSGKSSALFMKEQEKLKGRINHSVCRWCYNDIPLEDLCVAAREIGLIAIDLIGPEEWPVLQKYGLDCGMPQGAGLGIERGFNDPSLHDELVESYIELIPQVA